MYTCTLYPVGLMSDYSKPHITFKLRFSGPSPKPRTRTYAIADERDISDFLLWVAVKFDVTRFEYQPNLFFTWEWEPAFENAMLEFNLRSSAT